MKQGVFAYIDPRELRAMHKPALAQEHSTTSREAAARIEPTRGRLQLAVYLAVKGARDGLTAQEIEEATGLAGNTVRPRVVELVEQCRIHDSGRKRLTKSGRNAVVWVAS